MAAAAPQDLEALPIAGSNGVKVRSDTHQIAQN